MAHAQSCALLFLSDGAAVQRNLLTAAQIHRVTALRWHWTVRNFTPLRFHRRRAYLFAWRALATIPRSVRWEDQILQSGRRMWAQVRQWVASTDPEVGVRVAVLPALVITAKLAALTERSPLILMLRL